MVAAKRGAWTTDDRSIIVYALDSEHRFHDRYIWAPPQYEANPLSAPRCADIVGQYLIRHEFQGSFFFGFESTQLARQLHQERTQMEMQRDNVVYWKTKGKIKNHLQLMR